MLISDIFVHRGAGVSASGGDSLVPENSVAAFEHAAASGVAAVELDVWLTADLEVIVIHGGGTDSEGWLNETVCSLHVNRRIEEMDYQKAKRDGVLFHRRPWLKFLQGREEASPSTVDSSSSPPIGDLEIQQDSYLRDSCKHLDGTNDASFVPLLTEILDRFHGRLLFNVELKGTDPRLGHAVVHIARRYPGTVARISSFAWQVPPALLEWATNCYPDLVGHGILAQPNGFMIADLLGPLAMDAEVPLALLFGGPALPPLALVRRCAESYGCSWVHLPYSFDLSGAEDCQLVEEESVKWLAEDSELATLLGEFPETVSMETLLPSRSTVFKDAITLRVTVRYLRNYGIRVLVYGDRAHEMPCRLRLVLRCDVDGLCPNDGALALRLLEESKLRGRF